MKQYNLVFEGTVSDGHKVEEVKSNLAALFKADEKKIDQLFSAPQSVLKRNVDYEQAMKYREALQRAGAICSVEEVARNIDRQAVAPPVPPPIPKSASAQMVGGKRQSVIRSNPQAQTQKKKNRGPFLIGMGVAMLLIRVVKIGLVGDPGFMDLFMGGLGVFWIITGIRKVTQQS